MQSKVISYTKSKARNKVISKTKPWKKQGDKVIGKAKSKVNRKAIAKP